MENYAEYGDRLIAEALAHGAYKAALLDVCDVVTDVSFRTLCEQNSCGNYGKCWTCPPDAGPIDELCMALKKYRYCVLFQTVGQLEDSFDFEGMVRCKREHNALTTAMREASSRLGIPSPLILGAGGCGVCDVCAKRTNEPCRHPDLATSSLETYGVYVSETARRAGMKYVNGKDTVTYFGAVFFGL